MSSTRVVLNAMEYAGVPLSETGYGDVQVAGAVGEAVAAVGAVVAVTLAGGVGEVEADCHSMAVVDTG
jgi:hypothetical protein